MIQENLNITLLGVEASERANLLRMLQSTVSRHCRLVDTAVADVAIVNFERVSQKPSWARQTTNLPLILLASTEVRLPQSVCVVMPFAVQDIKQAFSTLQPLIDLRRRSRLAQDRLGADRQAHREVNALLSKQPKAYTRKAAELSNVDQDLRTSGVQRGDRIDIELRRGELSAEVVYHPATYLQSLVQGAVDESAAAGVPIVVRGLGGDLIIFDEGLRAFTRLDDGQLFGLCELPIEPDAISFIYDHDGVVDTQACLQESLPSDALLWKLAAWCSNGRLPASAALDRAITLARWPNLTRLMRLPHAVRIASLWFSEPVSLRATAVLLDLPYAGVFQFYSACLQLGLIQEHRRRATVRSIEKTSMAGRGYLGRVLAYLGRLRGQAV